MAVLMSDATRSRVGRLIGGGSSGQHTDSAACFPPLDDTTETRRSHPSPPPRGLPRVVSDAAKGFQSSIREHLIHPWIHCPEVLYCHSMNRDRHRHFLAAYSEGLRRVHYIQDHIWAEPLSALAVMLEWMTSAGAPASRCGDDEEVDVTILFVHTCRHRCSDRQSNTASMWIEGWTVPRANARCEARRRANQGRALLDVPSPVPSQTPCDSNASSSSSSVVGH